MDTTTELVGFEQDGFALVDDVISASQREALVNAVAHRAINSAGSRNLLEEPLCQDLAVQLRCDPRLSQFMPASARAVQCTYFEKSADTNWLVAYHQDLAVPLKARKDSPAWSGWSEKGGVTFAIAPTAVLQSLVAVRVHLDASTRENGPLRVIAGSHGLGRVVPTDLERHRREGREVVCLGPQGSALVFRPLLLHASSKSDSWVPRRVLHFLFGPLLLPDDMAWHFADDSVPARPPSVKRPT